VEENLKMSLLESAFETCNIINTTKQSDGYGGFKKAYTIGAPFDAAIVYNTSLEAKVAEKQGVTALYTVTTRRNVNLEYHDLIIRAKDNKVFRITTDGDDNLTPKSANLDMRQVSAEEFILGGTIENG